MFHLQLLDEIACTVQMLEADHLKLLDVNVSASTCFTMLLMTEQADRCMQ